MKQTVCKLIAYFRFQYLSQYCYYQIIIYDNNDISFIVGVIVFPRNNTYIYIYIYKEHLYKALEAIEIRNYFKELTRLKLDYILQT